MTKDARYKWTHGIVENKTDSVEGIDQPVKRGRRISMTFREKCRINSHVPHHIKTKGKINTIRNNHTNI